MEDATYGLGTNGQGKRLESLIDETISTNNIESDTEKNIAEFLRLINIYITNTEISCPPKSAVKIKTVLKEAEKIIRDVPTASSPEDLDVGQLALDYADIINDHVLEIKLEDMFGRLDEHFEKKPGNLKIV